MLDGITELERNRQHSKVMKVPAHLGCKETVVGLQDKELTFDRNIRNENQTSEGEKLITATSALTGKRGKKKPTSHMLAEKSYRMSYVFFNIVSQKSYPFPCNMDLFIFQSYCLSQSGIQGMSTCTHSLDFNTSLLKVICCIVKKLF